MTSPSETAMNQMAAKDETDMLERVPVPAEPLPAENPESPAASATASLSVRWHEIQAMFVDDPHEKQTRYDPEDWLPTSQERGNLRRSWMSGTPDKAPSSACNLGAAAALVAQGAPLGCVASSCIAALPEPPGGRPPNPRPTYL